jgi:membrane protein YqaA with SNARE-associated domain
MTMALALFAYAFVSNMAVAVIPHEPVVIWYGAHWGIWATAVVATAGTVVASAVDHRLFGPLVGRVSTQPALAGGMMGKIRKLFGRAPFAVIAVSGVTPLPAWPFKAAAFAERYPLGPYLAAVAAGRFPRYLLLAWLGFAISVPNWVLVALVVVMLLPSLRVWIWKRPSAK